jgi:hypothetical protein
VRRENLHVLRDSLLVAIRNAAETGVKSSTPEIVAAFRKNNRALVDLVSSALIDMALTRLVSDVAKRRGKKRVAPSQIDMFGARLGELLTVPKSPDGIGRPTQWRRFGSLRHSFAKRVVTDHLELRRRQDKYQDYDEIIRLSEPFVGSPDMSVDEAYALYLASQAGSGSGSGGTP